MFMMLASSASCHILLNFLLHTFPIEFSLQSLLCFQYPRMTTNWSIMYSLRSVPMIGAPFGKTNRPLNRNRPCTNVNPGCKLLSPSKSSMTLQSDSSFSTCWVSSSNIRAWEMDRAAMLTSSGMWDRILAALFSTPSRYSTSKP